jgi:CHAT domain-containing protein
VRSAENRGVFDGLTPLPHAAREVTEIGGLFPEGFARTYLGADATEERAKTDLAEARYVHFAAHGLADPEAPLDSFLALTIPEGLPEDRENGILQAWEIRDQLSLNADLVVLSACVTAFGPNRGGEGLLSLSRAFQIAGARTVAASLWPVADESTAELMIRLYRHLLEGEPKDEALRAAQMELIHNPIEVVGEDGERVKRDFSAPYHWAAFQLIGDWR